MRKLLLPLFLVMVSLTSQANAQDAQQKPANAAPKESEKPPRSGGDDSTDSFWANFGIGLSVSANLGKERSIEEAQLVNGTVRVTSERQVTPRLMLERHWYLSEGWDTKHEDGTLSNTKFRQGFFVGVSLLGDKKMMDAVSVGWLVGFKPNSNDKATHNLGLGIAVEPYSRVLGDGIEKNKPLPQGETSIRYKETNRTALIFFYTYTMGK